jgi:hypothetical protein
MGIAHLSSSINMYHIHYSSSAFSIFTDNANMSGGKRPTKAPPAAPPKKESPKMEDSRISKSTFYDQDDPPPEPSASKFYAPVSSAENDAAPLPRAPRRKSKLIASPSQSDEKESVASSSCAQEADSNLVTRTKENSLNAPPTKRLSKSDESLARKEAVRTKPKLKPKPQPRTSLKTSCPELSLPKTTGDEILAAMLPKAELKPKPKPKPRPVNLTTNAASPEKEDAKPTPVPTERSIRGLVEWFQDSENNAQSVSKDPDPLPKDNVPAQDIPPLPSKPPNASRLLKKKSRDDDHAKKEVDEVSL